MSETEGLREALRSIAGFTRTKPGGDPGSYQRGYDIGFNNAGLVAAGIAEAALAQAGASRPADALHIVFDGMPGPDGPRFVEVETPDGKSINAGEWRKRPDGLCELVIGASRPVGGEEVQPRAVAAAEAKVREDAANTLHHSTDGDARLMCRVGARELGQVLAHYEHIKSASRPLGDREAVAATSDGSVA